MSIFRDDILAGQVAFVTGGGSGICKGIAHKLMAHGCRVAIVSRTQSKLDAAAAELIARTGGECFAVAADVRDPDAVAAAIDATLARFGGLDIVVNGAAGNFLAPAAGLSPKGYRTVLDIDAVGTYTVCRTAYDKVLAKNGGHILNISATLHYTGVPFQTHAGAAKAAVDAMTRHLAVEWGPAGIRVNCIAPGPIDDTEGMSRLLPPGMRQTMEQAVPLRRFGRIDEIADAAVFLSSAAASYITGAVLVVDGGAWMGGGMKIIDGV